VEPEYANYYVSFIGCIEKMKSKDWERKEAPKVQCELVETCANMELRFPVNCSKQTRHVLVCRCIGQLNDWGSFWAIQMLWVEYYHTLGHVCFRNRLFRILCFVLFSYCFRTVFVLLSYCFRTVFVLFPYCFRTIFVLFSYCFRTVFVLSSYYFRTIFVLFSYCFRTVFGRVRVCVCVCVCECVYVFVQ
jgi:hypothetical protein